MAFTLIKAMPDAEAKAKGWMGTYKRGKRGNKGNDKKLYMQDTLDLIPGIASVSKKKFEENGITFVHQLASLDDNALKALSSMTRISTKRLCTFRDVSKQAEEGTSIYPQRYDHRQESNPFLSRYGSDWESHFLSSKLSGMRGKVCITHLIEHIESTTKAAYKGTKYESTYLWSHDALSQMIDNSCVEWMKKKITTSGG
jgi:predicted flap endonuclease-1-like 5' DNA nuclease